MPKIKVELEVGSEFCDNCPMFRLFPSRDMFAFCSLYNIYILATISGVCALR